MKKPLLKTMCLALLLCGGHTVAAEADVLFHDSTDPVFYDPSWVSQTAPSMVEVGTGTPDKLPVVAEPRQAGENALKLSWTSQAGGNWMALVAGIGWPAYHTNNVDSLTFWLYAPEAITPALLPEVNMEGHYGGQCGRLKLSDYVPSVPRAEWFQVTIPMEDFRKASPGFPAFNSIKGVFFHQSATDGARHTLYVDEIIFWGVPVIRQTEMLPYLQAPTPTSIVVNWHTLEKDPAPQVIYGTSRDRLDHTVTGSNEVIVDHIWNTVKLTGLQPDTEYFYQCISGEHRSDTCAFRTYREGKGSTVRLIFASDSQDDAEVNTRLVDQFTDLMKEKYGNDLHNHFHLICHMGDMVGGGGVIEQYENRYFRPFSPLTHAIPAATVTGNHDVEHSVYYSYVKYDDFANGVDGVNQEAFYTLKVNGVQMFMLNSNEGVRIQQQLDWLERALAATQQDDDVTLAFAGCHHPYYSEMWYGGSGADLTEDSYQGTPYVGKLLQRLQAAPKVAALFNGHVHAYERHVLPGTCEGGRDFLEITVGGAGGNLDRWGGPNPGPDIYESKVALDHYHFVVVEIDVDNRSFAGTMYSFGNPDRPLDGVVADTFYGKLDQPAPEQPAVLDFTPAEVTVSDYAGVDSLMTVHVQIADNEAFDNPLLDRMLDKVNIYDVDEHFVPINQNAGIDLKHIDITEAALNGTDSYHVRVRYRDNNLKWSEWSAPYPPATALDAPAPGADGLRAYHDGQVLHVRWNKTVEGKGLLTLYNAWAQALYNAPLDGTGQLNLAIPVGHLPKGIYALRGITDAGEQRVKLLLH